MNKLKKNKSGFGAIGLTLIIVIVALIGVVGWMVYKDYHKKVAPTYTAKTTDASTQLSPNSPKKYLTIKEWGVRAAYTSNYNLTYTLRSGSDNTGSSWADVSATELVNIDKNCALNGVGSVSRLAPSYVPDPGPNTIQQIAPHPDQYAHIGGYYYSAERGRAPCSDKPDATALQVKLYDIMNAIGPHIEAIPN